MDAVLKSLSFGFLLRSLFAGSFFVISYLVGAHGMSALTKLNASELFTTGVPFALLSGVTVYGLHRSLIYPLVEHGLNSKSARSARENYPLISDATVLVLKQLWSDGAATANVRQERSKHASLWADYVHLQYVSALCIGAGSLVLVQANPASYELHWPLLLLALLFAVAGLSSDWRLHRVRELLENAT